MNASAVKVAAVGARAIEFAYRPGAKVLDGVDLDLHSGEMTALVGPNGSGKSTLLKILAGLIEPDAGSVSLGGSDMAGLARAEVARKVAVVPQETRISLPFTVGEMVLMGRAPHIGYLGIESAADLAAARAACERADVWHLRDRLVWDLSGGEKQRAVIARALAQDPGVLLLDEPTTFLDLRHQVEVYAIVSGLASERGLAVLVVGHDINLAARHCERVVMLSAGKVYADGPAAQVLTPESVEEVFSLRARIEELSDGTRLVVHDPPRDLRRGGNSD